MMWRGVLYVLCLLCIEACGSSKPYVDNTYEAQLKEFTHAGVKAMQTSRWDAARHAFSRAVQFSELLSDPAFEVRSLYNLGMAYKGLGKWQQAQTTWLRAQKIAQQYGLARALDRVQIQLALLRPKQAKHIPIANKAWSADMYLSLGALLHIRSDDEGARSAYLQVLRMAADDKQGLLLQGRAMLGLARISPMVQRKHPHWAEQALACFRQVGAPMWTAQSLLLIAEDARYALWKRLDSARRAHKIYNLLRYTKAVQRAQKLVETLQYEGGADG